MDAVFLCSKHGYLTPLLITLSTERTNWIPTKKPSRNREGFFSYITIDYFIN
jgi:hypothetical protein